MLKNFQRCGQKATWTLLVSAGLSANLAATPEVQRGQQIYEQLCIDCHGPNGEGNDEEFVDPLFGEKSIESLARKIHRTMPEDEEHLCVDEDAAAVAAYIHGAFYSVEARAKLNPPKRDLVRLTNPQLKNSVADVVGNFFGGHYSRLPQEQGVKFSARGLHLESEGQNKFSATKRHKFERAGEDLFVDVRQEIGEEPLTTKSDIDASLWGSLLAEESGTYEFVIRSANGFRFWINESESQPPSIDAWVVSGREIREEKLSIELIGGRPYPIRLQWVVSPKDEHSSMQVLWKTPHGTLRPVPTRNLFNVYHPPSIVVTSSFPADDASFGYERGSGISKAWLESVNRAAIEAADFVDKHLDDLAKTKAGKKDRDEKIREFADRFVAAALRRPLDEEDRKIYLDRHFSQAKGANEAIRPIVIQALTSPRFLYPELRGKESPDSWLVASRLALTLWDSLPDGNLTKAAREGKLVSRDEVNRQAWRMLEDPRARAKMRGFFHHWLELERAENVAKDAKLFPEFDDQLMADLRTSLELFLDETVWSESSDFRQLLLADYLMLNPRLAEVYGKKLEGDGFQRVTFDPKERSGVVTHPFLLSNLAYHDNTSPIHRGVFLTRNVVGQQLKPPPEATVFKDADFDPSLTMREKVTALTREKACMACHSSINPLGFSLERYDAIGRWREKEGDKPIDASSDFTPETGDKIRIEGARDVAEFAASSPGAHRAFVRQMFHHLVKYGMVVHGLETEERLYQRFKNTDFKIRHLIVAIAEEAVLEGTPADLDAKTAAR
ncbi:DUF1592 domain-containing protein [Haloferula chungangensis]|uniref:DUF1592 domain-containing protein n=1 Tax=Haloferula chungangensis TaxID=1048331 RepID=A0ABW2L5A1_9BACT